MTLYATLADVKAELRAQSTVDDKEVLRAIRQVSRRIDRKFRSNVPLFAPVIETRSIPLDGLNINSFNKSLLLNTPLLSLTGVGIGSSTLTVGTNVQTYPATLAPWYGLQLIGSSWYSWYDYCSDSPSRYATVSGIWGYNANYAQAWLSVDALEADINTTVTTFTVADVDGDTPYGDTPRISPGNLVQIDSEWMDVIATDVDTNIVTVVRGVNGSAAAAHTADAVVKTYQVEDAIRRAVIRQTAFQYARQGAFDTVRIGDFSTVSFPKDLLDEVNGLLALFANM
jgi:hypothetical protein